MDPTALRRPAPGCAAPFTFSLLSLLLLLRYSFLTPASAPCQPWAAATPTCAAPCLAGGGRSCTGLDCARLATDCALTALQILSPVHCYKEISVARGCNCLPSRQQLDCRLMQRSGQRPPAQWRDGAVAEGRRPAGAAPPGAVIARIQPQPEAEAAAELASVGAEHASVKNAGGFAAAPPAGVARAPAPCPGSAA